MNRGFSFFVEGGPLWGLVCFTRALVAGITVSLAEFVFDPLPGNGGLERKGRQREKMDGGNDNHGGLGVPAQYGTPRESGGVAVGE
jgi:hypothetical protein